MPIPAALLPAVYPEIQYCLGSYSSSRILKGPLGKFLRFFASLRIDKLPTCMGTRFLKDCGMVEVKKEYKYWDPARVGKDGSRRVPDVTCVNPNNGTEYVLDARIYWNSMSNGPTGYTAYRHEGWGAEHGEAEKNSSWGEAIARRQEESVHNVKFVPFSLEAGGVWGPAAKKFFKQKTAYEMLRSLVGSEMCIRDRNINIGTPRGSEKTVHDAYQT